MTVAAYRDRASGRYPVFVPEIRDRAGALFGDEPPQDVIEALGLDPVQAVEPPTINPATETLREGEPEKMGSTWRQKWIIEAATPAPVAPKITYKADVWRRASPEQAAVIDTELTKLDVRMRRLWDDAAYLDHSQPEFLLLQQTMTAAFGKTETDRILAQSNV